MALRGPTPFLRLQGDERLVAMTRRGDQAAYEALVARYQSRLQSFCRHMLGSKEDAEDVLQEVFAAAFNAMMADDRPINLRPWLYRIARNRSLNHLRRQRAVGVDSMDVHIAEGGITTAEKVQKREDLRLLVTDVQGLAETQRTALLLREIDALSYDQIAEAMETTVPAIKSLLVRARVSLAEAAEARSLTCDEVRDELGEVAEGLKRMSPPVRRHIKTCDRCSAFHDLLKTNNKALAAVFPVGVLMLLKKLVLAHVGAGNAAAGASAGAGATATGGAVAATGGSMAAGGALSAGASALATKAVAGLAAVAIVSAGAVEVHNVRHHPVHHRTTALALAPAHPLVRAPSIVASAAQPTVAPVTPFLHHLRHHAIHKLVHKPVTTTADVAPAPVPVDTTPVPVPVDTTPAAPPQSESDATQLPSSDSSPTTTTETTPAPTTPVATTPVPVATTPPPVATTPPPVPVDTTPVAPPVDTTPVAPPVDTTPVDTTPVPDPPAPPAPPVVPVTP
jgi:RNA polymerase sigma factor (sigma-70 family)